MGSLRRQHRRCYCRCKANTRRVARHCILLIAERMGSGPTGEEPSIPLRGGSAGGVGVLSCFLRSSFDHLITHPFRDGAPFLGFYELLVETPPTAGALTTCFSIFVFTDNTLLPTLPPSCFAYVCSEHISSPRGGNRGFTIEPS